MKNSIITGSQMVKSIKEYKGGRELNDACRELGEHKSTFYDWGKELCRYGEPGTEAAERAGGREP